MENEITQIEIPVTVKTGVVKFEGYEYVKAQCLAVAEEINNLELNEDSIKYVKQRLADARKVTTRLDKSRKDIKAIVLSDFVDFESQLKEVIGIIDEADGKVRTKVRELEEMEREAKRQDIADIWSKRMDQFRITSLYSKSFETWLTPQHLNKTTSLKKVEADMTTWLQNKETELETIDALDNKEEVLIEYLSNGLNLNVAITTVKMRNTIKETVVKKEEPVEEDEPLAMFTIKGKANIKLVEMLLKENEIEYRKV